MRTGANFAVSQRRVSPRHPEYLHMAVGEIVPKDDGKPACDMAVQFATGFVCGAIIGVAARKVPNGLEAAERERAISLPQAADELKHSRIDQQPRLQFSGGSGIWSSRV